MNTSVIYTVVYLVIIVAIFYFLLIRPEKKRKKALTELRSNISVGDDITTIGGIVGTVVEIKDDFVTFETGADRVRLQVARWGISTTGKSSVEK